MSESFLSTPPGTSFGDIPRTIDHEGGTGNPPMVLAARACTMGGVLVPWGGSRAWHDIALAAFTYVEVFGKTQQLLGIVRCKRNEYETIMS